MSLSETLGLALLHRFDPETAHGLSLKALQLGLVPLPGPFTSPRLASTLAGMPLPNPVGLAAGLDKNATAVAALSRAGFGFVEVGAATPRPQPGNPRPRLFRIPEARAYSGPATEHTLNLGDARSLGWIPDASVHLVVTSPPYFNQA